MDQNARVEQAKKLILEGKCREAREILDAVLSVEPDNKFAHFEIGKIHQIWGDDQRAEKAYQKVVGVDPAFHMADLELARIYHRQHRFSQSVRYYERFLRKVKDNVEVYKELGRLYEGMGSPDDALASLEKAVALSPGDLDSMFELGRAYREASRDEDAAAVFRRILAEPLVAGDVYLHNKALNELEIAERREVLESKVRAMIAMVINRCNIKCRICTIWESDWQESDRTMQEIVSFFPHMEDICWQGGEVFLMKGFDDIMEEGTRHKNLNQVIFTNGLLINEKILNKLAKGKVDIVFSIDGATKETYEHIRFGGKFDRLRSVLSLVKEFRQSTGSNIKTYLNPVIMKRNHTELEQFIDFAKEYDFTSITFAPIRGDYGEENIFDNRDEAALAYLREAMPRALAKSSEYGIRTNNWLPLDCGCDDESQDCGGEAPAADTPAACGCQQHSPMDIVKPAASSRMICYSPWQRLLLDNLGQVRPFAFCTNWIGSTDKMSLTEMWNGEKMRWYRRKIAEHDYDDICQPECISGQVRDKICRPVEDR